MINQAQDVAEHLKKFGSITSFQAFELYGITRLSARIYELRSQGLNIITQNETTKNRHGNTTNYAKYILKENKND